MIIKELDANKMIENYHSGPKINEYNQNIILEKSEKWIRGRINDEIIMVSAIFPPLLSVIHTVQS